MEDVDTDLQISSSQDSLMEAALAALGTGDMTPLVKEELKLTIQSRRLASGKGELRVNFEPPINPVRGKILFCVVCVLDILQKSELISSHFIDCISINFS